MLVTCPECSNKVSEAAEICPQCGLYSPGLISEEFVKRGAQKYVIGKTSGNTDTCEKHWFSKHHLLISDVKVAKHKNGCQTGWYLAVYKVCPSCGERTMSVGGCESCES